jgi:uncharacterized protein (DUF305 family)
MMFAATVILSGLTLAQATKPGMKMDSSAAPMPVGKMTLEKTSAEQMAPGMAGMNSVMSSLSRLTGKGFDRAFLSAMIAHHQAALAMSKAALLLCRDVQVRSWATSIIKSQSQQVEIGTMNALLEPLGGPNAPLMASTQQSMGGSASQIANSKTPDFAFVQGMLPHHSSAIDMAQLALETSRDPQVLKLSKAIVVAQAGEMYDFQTWIARH